MSSWEEADLFTPSLSALDDLPGTTPLAWHRRPLYPFFTCVATLFLGFVPGFLLLARNYDLLGDQRSARRAYGFVAVSILLVAASFNVKWYWTVMALFSPFNVLAVGLVAVLAFRQPLRVRSVDPPIWIALPMAVAGFGWFVLLVQTVLPHSPGR